MAYVQSKSGHTGLDTQLTLTLDAPSAIGNVITVGFVLVNSYNGLTATVTDNAGNAYTLRAFDSGSTGNQSTLAFTCTNKSAITLSITITLSESRNIHGAVIESSGIVEPPTAVAYGSSDSNGVTTQFPTPGVSIPAGSYCIGIASNQGFSNNVTWLADSPYTLREEDGANGGGALGFGSIGVYDNIFGTLQSAYQWNVVSSDIPANAACQVAILLVLGPGPPPPPPPPLADIITDVCERAGLVDSQFDVSLVSNGANFPTLGNIVPGYVVERPTPAAQIIKTLMDSYFFDACEEDGKIRFIPRGMPAAMTIPEADLGLVSDRTKLTAQQKQEQDLPHEVTVLYYDPAIDYQQGKQHKQRNSRVVQTRQQDVLSIPLTMSGTQARSVAEIALFNFWLERNSYAMNLWRAIYMLLSPTDVVEFVYKGVTLQIRVVENSLGVGYVIALHGVSDDQRIYISSIIAGVDAGFPSPNLILAAPTLLFLFDTPLLEDADANPGGTGYYFAMSSPIPKWQGGILNKSSDDVSFAQEAPPDAMPASFGFATTTLGPPRSPWTWDNANTLTVKMQIGSLSSDTMLGVLNGSNAMLYGSELIQFTTAVQNMDGTYTLSGLLRGRRGTEWACGTHASGELVVLPLTGIERVADPLSIIGLLRYYRAVTIGQDITTVASTQFTIKGNDLKPYAPTSIAGARDGSNNLSLSWIRRTRIGGAWLDGMGVVPVSEDSEAYEVDILNGFSVVRTISGLSSPAASYSAAQQTTDFGSAQSAILVNIYQLSGEIGRGFVKSAVV